MPFVKVLSQRATSTEVGKFVSALQELIPAALHSKQGPLTPVCLDISGARVEPPFRINTKFLVTITARDCEDRKENLKEREEQLVAALAELFPGLSFAVRLELKDMMWVSIGPKAKTGVDDMSMQAAVLRARAIIDYIPG